MVQLAPICIYQAEIPGELENIISQFDKPLSLYVFSTNKKFCQQVIDNYSFGGGCINDTIVYFANKRLPEELVTLVLELIMVTILSKHFHTLNQF